jgi:hypothetical protein
MWTLVPAVAAQDLFFTAAQIQLQVVLVHLSIPMVIHMRAISMI